MSVLEADESSNYELNQYAPEPSSFDLDQNQPSDTLQQLVGHEEIVVDGEEQRATTQLQQRVS